jgi:alpha-beta hydrolase superfamily lysophospholipase
MGSLIVLDFLLGGGDETPASVGAGEPLALRGAIVSGAPLHAAGVDRPALLAVARVLSALFPACPLPVRVDGTTLSRDPEAVRAYLADPLVCPRVTARWGTEILAAMARVKAGAPRLTTPLLILHGEADRLSLADGARWLFDAVRSADKTLRLYPGARHEPHNDLGHEEVARDLAQWIQARA